MRIHLKELKNLHTLRYLSSKGGSGARIRKISVTQTVTKRLTSLSRFLRRPCFIMDLFRGLNSASSSFRAFFLFAISVTKGCSICDRAVATSWKITDIECKQTDYFGSDQQLAYRLPRRRKNQNRYQMYKARDAVTAKPEREIKKNRHRLGFSQITPSNQKPTQIQVDFQGIELFRSEKQVVDSEEIKPKSDQIE